jgi:hypothetical protein
MRGCHCEEALGTDAALPLKGEIASSFRSSQRRTCGYSDIPITHYPLPITQFQVPRSGCEAAMSFLEIVTFLNYAIGRNTKV